MDTRSLLGVRNRWKATAAAGITHLPALLRPLVMDGHAVVRSWTLLSSYQHQYPPGACSAACTYLWMSADSIYSHFHSAFKDDYTEFMACGALPPEARKPAACPPRGYRSSSAGTPAAAAAAAVEAAAAPSPAPPGGYGYTPTPATASASTLHQGCTIRVQLASQRVALEAHMRKLRTALIQRDEQGWKGRRGETKTFWSESGAMQDVAQIQNCQLAGDTLITDSGVPFRPGVYVFLYTLARELLRRHCISGIQTAQFPTACAYAGDAVTAAVAIAVSAAAAGHGGHRLSTLWWRSCEHVARDRQSAGCGSIDTGTSLVCLACAAHGSATAVAGEKRSHRCKLKLMLYEGGDAPQQRQGAQHGNGDCILVT
ncbi:hypothetical protein VOLCADRAFT_94433 [Volvox carteri f. nagariensis]|uniref:Uncharacterized protein n=1 Tax=Volvox carteri f. nagariensis TaxID=3068 RepID=D8U4S7_VOLCA|nr:uncharacterized protein VOLCADRAFT_94433 [Volvox carteri f. nagariensis]EFJ45328.1 hypothetical protein VOLCADRAFT_94433 [Volvox carteri f. nagariensis]|eukprot:XP_002953704.1 hypothetical protein VOLCADRAFT_94433 [Volvox carteri f. nagariensis]